MSDLVELEHAALAGQVVNMQLQRVSETQPSDNQRKLIMKAKADIQQEMLRTNTFKSGYLIWLDLNRDISWNSLSRTQILPRLPVQGDRSDEVQEQLLV